MITNENEKANSHQLMEGKGIERPSNAAALDDTFKKAPKADAKGGEQGGLAL
jgi:hypothetical protein